jgi:hypothetical protein
VNVCTQRNCSTHSPPNGFLGSIIPMRIRFMVAKKGVQIFYSACQAGQLCPIGFSNGPLGTHVARGTDVKVRLPESGSASKRLSESVLGVKVLLSESGSASKRLSELVRGVGAASQRD